jgi:hypothetical protein
MASELDTRWQAIITAVGGAQGGGTATSGKPLITGRADPHATINVSDSATPIGSAVADAQGNWSLQPSAAFTNGLHDLSATQVTEYGAGSNASYFAVTVNAPDAPSTESADTRRLENWAHFPANPFHTRPPADASNDAHGLAALTDNPRLYLRHASKGVDMVALLGDHQVLDLTSIVDKATAAAQIPGIGGFDLGGHHNALKLSLADVLTLGERDLFLDDGKRQLMVTGQEGDLVDLSSSHVPGLPDSGWEHHGTAEVGGVMYNVVAHSSTHTELLVSQEVQVDLH